MSWIAPVTRATGYIVLATDWNAIQTNSLLLDRVYAKKTTTKTVNTSTTATDLLNSEFLITGGDMGTARTARLTAWGKWKQNVATSKDVPTFQLILGGVTLIDTNSLGFSAAQQINQYWGWKLVCDVQNLGAANVQQAYLAGRLNMFAFNASATNNSFTTGNGTIDYPGAAGPGSAGVVIYDGGNDGLAVDTTTNHLLQLKVVNAISNAQYGTQLLGAVLELL